MINKEFNLDKFKKQSAKVSGFLSEKGHTIPKSTILHALSIFLEEKNWNTLSAKLEDKKITKNILRNPPVDMDFLTTLNKDCVSILHYIYSEIFHKHFPVENQKLLNENLKNIVDKILVPDGIRPISSRKIFPNSDILVEEMHLIGDEQILKISFGYNKKMDNVFPGYCTFNFFDFLSYAISLMTKPNAITGSHLGDNILGSTTHVCLDSFYRSKAYFFVPLSIKEDFVKPFTGNSASAFALSGKKTDSQKNLQINDIETDYLKDRLTLLGLEDIQINSCFLNEPGINDFLKTR